jgi:hypothetical protein
MSADPPPKHREPTLLTLLKFEWTAMWKNAVLRGQQFAIDEIGALWNAYKDQHDAGEPLVCFICDRDCAFPPFTQILPDRDKSKLIAAPCCDVCRELPTMVRLHRAMNVHKSMFYDGKRQVHFDFSPHKYHPR